MAYYTGTATNHRDMLNQLGAKAVLNGWTYVTDDTNPNAIIHYFKIHGIIVTFIDNITGTGYETERIYLETEGGGSYNVGVHARSTYFNYNSWMHSESVVSFHFYINTTGAPTIFVAMEILPNIWRHFHFGIIEKYDITQLGGAFIIGSYVPYPANYNQNSHLGLCNDDNYGVVSHQDDEGVLRMGNFGTGSSYTVDSALRYAKATGYTLTIGSAIDLTDPVLGKQPNESTGELVLVPIEIFVMRLGSLWGRFGTLPNVALVNSRYNQDAQTVVIDTDTWQFFPTRANGYTADTGLVEQSAWHGLAYKRT